MSKLIKDDKNQGAVADTSPQLVPLSGAVVVSHLKACQSIATKSIKSIIKPFFSGFEKNIQAEINYAKSDFDARSWSEALSVVRDNKERLERYFCGYAAEAFVKFKRKQLAIEIGPANPQEELSLVGNEELDESILISSIAQRADTYFAEPIWALNQRYALLNGGEPVTERNNPAAPIQFCEALRKALNVLPLQVKAKLLAYKAFDEVIIDLLREALQENNNYLKKQGILPHLKYSLPTQAAPESAFNHSGESGGSREAVNHDEIQGLSDQNLSPEEYQRNLLQAIRSLQLQLKKEDGVVPVAAPPGGVVVSSTELLQALQVLQSTPVALPAIASAGQSVVPVNVSAILDTLKEQIQKDKSGGYIDENNMRTIDLVGMLFEYMLSDENLPHVVKVLLSHLHTPFLKIAFVDPGFFEQAEHPARLLINSLAEAGARWVGNDGTSQYDIYEKIKAVVDKILKEFNHDVKIFTVLLLEFNSYTKNIFRRQQLLEKRATEKALGEEKLKEVKLKVAAEIRSRTQDKELPSAVLLFLLQPWSDYMSFALLRYGDSSKKWTKALTVIDDLIWGIEPKDDEDDIFRQQQNYDDLLAAINEGFDTIGYEQTKSAKLTDALSALLKLAIQHRKAEPAADSMRAELERIAAERGDFDQEPEDCTQEESQMVESLKMIEFGTWFEFEGGRRLKVAWYNARTSHYMLVDQVGKRVDMMSGLKMAREMIAGTAKIISGSSKPFFERALENIFHKLNQRADALNPGGSV